MVVLFLDQQNLGLRRHLKESGISVRDMTEILGHDDTRTGVPDIDIIEFLGKNPDLVLVTKDRGLARQCEQRNLQVMYIDETETIASEVVRRVRRMEG